MLKYLKKEKKNLLILFSLITLVSLMCFLPSLIKGVPITFGTDIKPQWFEFYSEFRNLITRFIKYHELPFYSWNMFLGNNFWASKSYYLIGDIYNYLGLLKKGSFFDIARNLAYLKFIVGGFGFYFYLSEVDRKPLSKIITSLAYAFSGWAIFFSGQLVFLSFYSFVPYFLWGIERSFKKKSPIVFILVCAILFSTNFYFFYTLSLMAPIYYIYRYYVLGLDFKDFFKRVLLQILWYIIGILITAVFWLPGVLYILNSPRFEGANDQFNIFVYLNMIFSSFIPNYLYIYRNNALETSVHYTREICMWASSALIILLGQFISIYKKKEKIATLIIYLIFIIIMINPRLDSMMHGFGDPSLRWVFIIVIFNLYIISNILDKIKDIKIKNLTLTTIICILMPIIAFLLAIYLRNETIFDYKKQLFIILVSVFIMILSYILIRMSKIKYLLILVTLELGLSAMYCFGHDVYSKPDDTYEYLDRLTSVIQSYPGQIMEEINSLDPNNDKEFIRLYIPHDTVYWSFSHNLSLNYGIKGLMTYDSTYAYAFSSMYHMEPRVSEFGSGWIFNIKDVNLMSFLSTKYAIGYKPNDEWILVNDDYHYGFKIYENPNYRPLGNTYSKMMSTHEYKTKKDTAIFLDYVVSDNQKIKEYLSDAKSSLVNIYNQANHLSADYTADKDGFMVTSLPYDEGWKILVDDEIIDYYDCNGGFISFAIKEGSHHIEMSFIPKGFKLGIILSVIGTLLFSIILFLNIKKR